MGQRKDQERKTEPHSVKVDRSLFVFENKLLPLSEVQYGEQPVQIYTVLQLDHVCCDAKEEGREAKYILTFLIGCQFFDVHCSLSEFVLGVAMD
jgi:hypothetical protein